MNKRGKTGGKKSMICLNTWYEATTDKGSLQVCRPSCHWVKHHREMSRARSQMSVLMEVVQICDGSSPRRLRPSAISLQAGKAVGLELPLLLKGALSAAGGHCRLPGLDSPIAVRLGQVWFHGWAIWPARMDIIPPPRLRAANTSMAKGEQRSGREPMAYRFTEIFELYIQLKIKLSTNFV
jgi:hypothetical protein